MSNTPPGAPLFRHRSILTSIKPRCNREDLKFDKYRIKEGMMARVQLALRVADLDSSVEFYRRLFGVEPAKRRSGYANFAVTEPPLKLVLIEGEAGQATVLDHLGIEVESTEQVRAAAAGLSGQGLGTA